MAQFISGEQISDWTLVDFLGEGGNAEVWRSARASGEVLAVKILKSRRTNSEPYARFQQEIDTLQRVGRFPGIVPIVDFHLPVSPSTHDRAWLAMPVAIPLADVLAKRSLREVVTAVAVIAYTLSELERLHGIHHRDIKPSNLYSLNDQPAISDFGIADIPDGLDLTSSGRPLGPAHFLPYEMLADAKNAAPGPADVYSLAKTLWVLCTDQKWPPQGEQSSTNAALSIGAYRPHPLARQLDELIERCTTHLPAARPSMTTLRAELQAWLSLDSQTAATALDTANQWRMLREVAEPRLSEAEKDLEYERCVLGAARRLQELLQALQTEIRLNFPAAEFDRRPKYVKTFFNYHQPFEVHLEDIRATIISGPGYDPIRLVLALSVMVKTDRQLHYQGVYYLGRTETMGGQIDFWSSATTAVGCGTIELEFGLASLARQMSDAFPDWLTKLTAALQADER